MDSLIYDYIEENELHHNQSDDIDINSIEFQTWIKNYLFDKFDNIVEDIDSYFYNEKITLYREIFVRPDWLEHLKKEGKRLGIFWTYKENMTDSYWGDYDKGDLKVKMKIIIDNKHINWYDTILLNLRNPEEYEIRLFKNTPIKIEGLDIDGKAVDISSIKDKIFLA